MPKNIYSCTVPGRIIYGLNKHSNESSRHFSGPGIAYIGDDYALMEEFAGNTCMFANVKC